VQSKAISDNCMHRVETEASYWPFLPRFVF
jgi:hypothetical protein